MLAENVRDALPEAMHEYYDRWRTLQLPRTGEEAKREM